MSGKFAHDSYLIFADPPVFGKRLFSEELVVGSSHVLNLTARAQPGEIAYRWSRESPDSAPVPETAGPVLKLNSVSRTDAGWYHLRGANAEGSTTVRVHINVLCEWQRHHRLH